MINLRKSSFYEMLPPNFQNQSTIALSYALDRQMKKLVDYSYITLLYVNISGLTEKMLDTISDNFKIAGYNKQYDIDTKKTLLLEAFLKYSRLGTKGSVDELVKTVFGDGDVSEWQDYSGKPYFFRINLVDKSMPPEVFYPFAQNLFKTKNVRSWLEYLMMEENNTHNVFAGTLNHELETETIDTIPPMEDILEDGLLYMAAVLHDMEIETINMISEMEDISIDETVYAGLLLHDMEAETYIVGR